MTRLIDTSIGEISRSATTITLSIRAYIEFTGTDLSKGQSGEATFKVSSWLRDDDPVFDDDIDRRVVTLLPSGIQALTKVAANLTVSWQKLRGNEPVGETIELYGQVRLYRGSTQIAMATTNNLNVTVFREETPVPPGVLLVNPRVVNGEPTFRIDGLNFGASRHITVIVSGFGFPEIRVQTITVPSGSFQIDQVVPCSGNDSVTVTAFDSGDHPGTTVVTSALCPLSVAGKGDTAPRATTLGS